MASFDTWVKVINFSFDPPSIDKSVAKIALLPVINLKFICNGWSILFKCKNVEWISINFEI